MDEQSSDGQRPGIWESWTAPADPSIQPQAGEARQTADFGPARESGNPDASSRAASSRAGAGELPAFTQPIGYPPPGYGQPGYGQPGGYGQPPGHYGVPGGYGQPPRPPRRRALTAAITYIAVAAVAATAGSLVVAFADGSQPPAASSGSAGSGNLGQPGNSLFPGGSTNGNANNGSSNSGNSGAISQGTMRRLRNAVTPGLVVITSNLQYDGQGMGAAATGMIISHSGLVLTNNHVINGTTGLTATVVTTGRQYTARWLGYDKGSDVAVIQLVGASGLPTVPIGDSSSVKIGDQVVGMGNANGTGKISYVAGTITNLNQTITASDNGSGEAAETLTGMLQTNAQIIPGDSGGPLVSTDGKVIGMDTAASVNSTANSGQDVGFAIPINRALALARRIIAGHPAVGIRIGSSGFVGVLVPSGKNGTQSTSASPRAQLQQQVQDVTGQGGQVTPAPGGCVQNDQQAGLPTRIAPVSSGTLILGSLCQTPASAAGINAGDVITRVNNQPVSSPASLMNILQGVHSGATVRLTWVTPAGQTVTRKVTLAAAPPQ